MLIDAAADILATNLEPIAEQLGYPAAWDYLAKIELVNREIAQDKYPACFAAFFARAKEQVRTAPIALLADGNISTPDGCVVPQNPEEYLAGDVLVALDVPLIHESIRAAVMQTSHTQYGIHLLNTSGIVEALTGPRSRYDVDAAGRRSDVIPGGRHTPEAPATAARTRRPVRPRRRRRRPSRHCSLP